MKAFDIFRAAASVFLILAGVAAAFPEMYMGREYAAWQWQREYAERDDIDYEVVILGGAAAKSAIIPEKLGVNAVNLAVGDAGPEEAYYALRSYLAHHPRPIRVIAAWSPHALAGGGRYARTMYMHGLSPDDAIDGRLRIWEAEGRDVWGKIRDAVDDMACLLYLPTKYAGEMIKSGMSRADEYRELFSRHEKNRGYEPRRQGRKSGGKSREVKGRFRARASATHYIAEINRLCRERGTPLVLEQLPVSGERYDAMKKSGYLKSYERYMRQLRKKLKLRTARSIPRYDDALFSDTERLSEKGAADFTSELKERYISRSRTPREKKRPPV